MNNLKLVFLAACLYAACSLQAQITKETVQIFFASGAQQMEPKQQARLDSLANAAQTWGEYEWKITAYTDDIGLAQNNKILSEQRAANVAQYLKNKGLSPKKESQLGQGEVLAKTAHLSALERANMRRVDIEITHIRLRDLTDFFDYGTQRSSRFYSVADPSRPQTIRGSKGGGIALPENAFARADGKPVAGAVQIELREAYSFGDMLLQQLSTTSGDRLLETGGMIYVNATDAEGAPLQLASGKTIQIALPQRRQLPPDMQIFVADRAGDHSEDNIDWQATNRPFSQRSRVSRQSDLINLSMPSAPKAANIPAQLNYKKWFPRGKAPLIDTTTYIKPTKPAMPELRAPDINDVYAETKRKLAETDAHYQRRVKDEFAARQADYEKAYETDRHNQKAYLDSLERYHKQTNAQNASIRRYTLHADSMSRGLDSVFFNYYVPNAEIVAWHNQIHDKFSRPYVSQSTLQAADVLGIDATRPEFAALKRSQDTLLADLNTLASLINEISREQMADFLPDPKSTLLAPLNNPLFNNRYAIFSNQWNKETRMRFVYRDYKLDSLLKKNFGEFCADYLANEAPKLAALTHDSIPAMLDKYNQNPYMHCADLAERCNKRHFTIRVRYKEKKNELKELTSEEIGEAVADVTRLGWINCDKFSDYPPDACTHIDLYTANDGHTRFYVILPSISSIITLNFDGKSFNTKLYKGIPKHLKAKLVGIRVKDGQTSLHIHEDIASKVAQTPINFKPYSLEEAMKTFAGL